MSSIIIPGEITDSKRKEKDCCDFKPADDGTLVGDTKYCYYSFECRQIGMRSDWIQFRDAATGEVRFDYMCTGMYGKQEDRFVDEEIS